MSQVVHQRGLGQVRPLCDGESAPLGWAHAGSEVTCPACAWKPLRDAWSALTTVAQAVVEGYIAAFRALAEALGMSDQGDSA